MTVATELVHLLESFAARTVLPRVRALHLPPASAAGTRSAEFCALELDDGSIGLTYVLLGDTFGGLLAGRGAIAGGEDALALARRYADDGGLGRVLGFAAVNALTACLYARAGFRPDTSSDSIGQLDPRPGDHVGMIGFFPPLVGRIVAAGARLTVAELDPAFAGERDGYRVTLDPSELSGCNKLLSTSTVLLNDSLDRMLGHCVSARYFAMVGPGAGCLPDPLFARGVTLLGGSLVSDREAFLDALARGAPWGCHAVKFALARDAYPGTMALLGRL